MRLYRHEGDLCSYADTDGIKHSEIVYNQPYSHEFLDVCHPKEMITRSRSECQLYLMFDFRRPCDCFIRL